MKCLVCQVTWEEPPPVCPQCGYDHARHGARQPRALLAARRAFAEKNAAYAVEARVRRWDRLQPWMAVALALLLLVVWLRACSGALRF